MQNHWLWYLFAAAIILLGTSISPAQVVATYSGTAVAPSQLPIQGVVVSAFGAPNDTTDAAGEFQLEFTALRDTTGNIQPTSFSHPLFLPQVLGVAIASGENVTGQVVTLFPVVLTFAVTGRVTSLEGTPLTDVQSVVVELLEASGQVFTAFADPDGSYETEVNQGSYFVRAGALFRSGKAFSRISKWFDNVDDLSDATLVEINSDRTINFSLRQLRVGSISGSVTDLATAQPLSQAFVFLSSEVPSDSSENTTDENGNYTVSAFEGTYFARAEKAGFVRLFYDNVQNLFAATPVVIDESNLNVTGIDFALFTGDGSNSISGTVVDEATGVAIAGAEMVAMTADKKSFSAVTNDNGFYRIATLPDGEYYVCAYHEDYIPHFYGTTAQRWEDATPIRLANGISVSGIDFGLQALQSFVGQISGTTFAGSSALSGALVSVFDQENVLVSADNSYYNGYFTISGLPTGEYTLLASKIGFNSITLPGKIAINLASTPVASGAIVQLESVTAVDEEDDPDVPSRFSLNPNYPNPFNPSTVIRFALPEAAVVEISVYDVLGRRVRTLLNELRPLGNHQISWDGRDEHGAVVSSGILFYRIKAGQFSETKRMVLLR
ncbi:MAG TPA: carboxypeptidase regulatory-like domain-containing protein [bacterium]